LPQGATYRPRVDRPTIETAVQGAARDAGSALKGCLRPVPTQLFHDRIAVVRLDDRGPRAQRTGALRSDLFILLEGELDLLVAPRSASQRDLVEGAREGAGTAAGPGVIL
jgi:hypothetical protein